jgi:hypothetical protein
MEVMKEKPKQLMVKITVEQEDDCGDVVNDLTQVRYAYGTVVGAMAEFFGEKKAKKPRAKRRTKAEIEAAKQDDPPAPEGTISSEPVEKKHRRIFP